MAAFRVRWEIDLEADTPLEAAKEALAIQLQPALAAVFSVRNMDLDPKEIWDEIDLTPDEMGTAEE